MHCHCNGSSCERFFYRTSLHSDSLKESHAKNLRSSPKTLSKMEVKGFCPSIPSFHHIFKVNKLISSAIWPAQHTSRQGNPKSRVGFVRPYGPTSYLTLWQTVCLTKNALTKCRTTIYGRKVYQHSTDPNIDRRQEKGNVLFSNRHSVDMQCLTCRLITSEVVKRISR